MEDAMLEANARYDIVVSETKRFEIKNGRTGLEHLTPALAPLPIYACLPSITPLLRGSFDEGIWPRQQSRQVGSHDV